jgi:FtsH-binding integral membrane protein
MMAGQRSEFTMANWSDPRTTAAASPTSVGTREAAYDAGLRSYMLSVYNYMASGVLLTGIVALLFSWGGAESPAATLIMAGGPLAWIIMLSPLAFVMVLSFGINRLSTGTAQMLFWAFAVVMGLSMSTIFLRFTGVSIAQTFFATTAAFAGLSLYGYTTKRDLSAFGTFLVMGVVGLLVAMIINIFLQSSAMALVISAIGVLLFAGLTAYDTQRIKSMYAYVAGTDMMGKTVIMGALSLYLDFVNMFTFLLNFMGSRE